MQRCIGIVLAVVLGWSALGFSAIQRSTQAAGRPNTIPALREWTDGPASYTFSSGARIVLESAWSAQLSGTGGVFAEDLLALTSKSIPVVIGTSSDLRAGDIYLTLGSSDTALGTQGYQLTIGDRISISARTADGAFYGTRSVLQLLKQNTSISGGTARDWPNYPQRSLMVDVGRKYFTIAWLQNHIRELAYLKYNYFHLHLSDNYGFRLESSRHPEIVSPQYYTKQQISDLIALAAKYHITIVPEIDMPGHMDAILANHRDLQLVSSSNVRDAGKIDLSKDASYTLLNDLLQEYIPLFPGPYFHIGADEYIPESQYGNYPQLLTYARAHYGANANAKDTYLGMINWANGIVKSKGKITRAWNDGLDNGSAVTVQSDIVVEHWYSYGPTPQQSLDLGHTIVNANGDYLYYVLGVSWKPNSANLYQSFEPHIFQANRTVQVLHARNLGAKLHVWCDYPNAETEAQVAAGIKDPLRALAQKNWGSPKLVANYSDFVPIITAIGRAPGYGGSTPSNNLALNRPASASSLEAAGLPASAAVDGDAGSRWASQYSDPQWLQVDLGSTKAINRVVLNWEAAYGKAYQIQVSNDGSSWSNIYSTSGGDGGIDDLGLSGSGRYIRMYGTQRGSSYGYSLYEFEVYGPSTTPTPTPSTPTPTPSTPTPTPSPTRLFSDDFESDKGWVRNPNGNDTATLGQWERGDPEATDYDGPKQLGTPSSGINDLVTGRLAGSGVGAYDIDGGITSIRSPSISLPSSGSLGLSLRYYLAHANNAGADDYLRVKIVGSTTSIVFEKLGAASDVDASWQNATISLNSYAGQTIHILIEAADAGSGSLVEAAIDDLTVRAN